MSSAFSTLFFSPTMSNFPDNVSDPTVSAWFDQISFQEHYQLTLRKGTSVALNTGQTYTLTEPSSVVTASWRVLVIGVEGSIKVSTTGFDTDGVTAITGVLPIYGNATLPGYILLSTYNLSSVTITSLVDNSAVQIFQGIAIEDGT